MAASAPSAVAGANAAREASLKVGGAAVKVAVKAPAAQKRVSFSLAKAATVLVTFESWTFPTDGATSAYLTTNSGRRIGGRQPLNGSGPWSPAPYRLAAGKYDLVVGTGRSRDSGSVTVRLTHVGTISPNGSAVAASIRSAEQPVVLAFKAKAGATVAVIATKPTFKLKDGATLGIESASGIAQGPEQFLGATSRTVSAVATIRAAGTYYVTLQPAGPRSAGSATLRLRLTSVARSVAVGGPAVTVSTKALGLPATASFRVSAAAEVAVVVHSTTLAGYTARLYVTNSKGTPVGPEQYLHRAGAAVGPVTLPAAGRYTVVIDPGLPQATGSSQATASVRFSLIKVADVRLHCTVGGGAVTAVIKKATERAFITFAAKANEQVLVKYSGNTLRKPADTIQLDGPGGVVIDAPTALTGAAGSLAAATLSKQGTYTVLVDPSFDGDTGRVSVTVSQASGTAHTARSPADASAPRPVSPAPGKRGAPPPRAPLSRSPIRTWEALSSCSACRVPSPSRAITTQATSARPGPATPTAQ